MNPKTWFLLILALVCGAGASFCVKSIFFVDGPARAVDANDEFGPKERILIANAALPVGTELTAQNVRLNLILESKIPRDAIFSFDGLAGRKTLRDVAADAPISLYDLELEETAAAPETSFVPPGHSVVPIEIQTATNAKGGRNFLKTTPLDRMIKAGDVVDLAVVKEDSAAPVDATAPRRPRLTTKTIVEGVAVFGVSDEKRFAVEENDAQRVSIVSVLLSSEQLAIVQKASDEGKIKVLTTNRGETEPFEASESLNLTSILVDPTDVGAESVATSSQKSVDAPIVDVPMNDDVAFPGLTAASDETADDSESASVENAAERAGLDANANQKSTANNDETEAGADSNFSAFELPVNYSKPVEDAAETVEEPLADKPNGGFRTRRTSAPVAEAVVPTPDARQASVELSNDAANSSVETLKAPARLGAVKWKSADENAADGDGAQASAPIAKKKFNYYSPFVTKKSSRD